MARQCGHITLSAGTLLGLPESVTHHACLPAEVALSKSYNLKLGSGSKAPELRVTCLAPDGTRLPFSIPLSKMGKDGSCMKVSLLAGQGRWGHGSVALEPWSRGQLL